MKKKLLISFLLIAVVSTLLLVFFAGDNNDDITAHRQELTLNGRNLYYEIPGTPPPPGGYRVIIAYHGMTQHYGVWYKEGTTAYVLPNWISNIMGTANQSNLVTFARKKGIVILMPDSQDIRIAFPLLIGPGQKGFDLLGRTMENNKDHTFTRDMLDWLKNDIPVKINMNKIIAVGVCAGAIYISGLQHVPELRHRFAAYVIGSGGYPNHVSENIIPLISGCRSESFDCKSDIDIPSDTSPTVMTFGLGDLIVPTAYSQNYLRNLLKAEVPVLVMTDEEDFPLDWTGHSYPHPSRNFEEKAYTWIQNQINK